MTPAERNYRLLQEMDANRRFLLLAYSQNPKLLAKADARIKRLLSPSADIEADLKNGLDAA